MRRSFEDWQVEALRRWALENPALAEEALNTLWSQVPGLYEKLLFDSVHSESLTLSDAADRLGEPEILVQERYAAYLAIAEIPQTRAALERESGKCTRLAGSGVTVWEIVRFFRKSENFEDLQRAFPALTRLELITALEYGQNEPDEIQRDIEAYEQIRAKTRSEYPSLT